MRTVALIVLIGLTAFACGNQQQTDVDIEAVAPISNEEMRVIKLAEIDSLEQILASDTFLTDKKTVQALLSKYDKYAAVFTGDKARSPEFLFKAGALARGIGEPVKAIRSYDALLSRFPDYERGPEAAFLVGFTYDADLNDRELAKEAYLEVVELYPGDTWATQARQRLESIDMTDEELLQFIMKKNADS